MYRANRNGIGTGDLGFCILSTVIRQTDGREV